MSRIRRETWYSESLLRKNRLSRSGETSNSMFKGYTPRRACRIDSSSTSVPKIWIRFSDACSPRNSTRHIAME